MYIKIYLYNNNIIHIIIHIYNRFYLIVHTITLLNNFQHRNKKTYELYAPIVHLIKSSGIEGLKKILKRFNSEIQDENEKTEIIKSENKSLNAGFSVKYCGSIYIGTKGDVKQIERAILQVLKSEEIKLVPVKFECLELGIRVTQDSNDMVYKQFLSYINI